MTYAARYGVIAENLQARIAVVPNVGRVHTTLRRIKDRDGFNDVALDRTKNRVACWFITRTSYEEEVRSFPQNFRASQYQLLGFLSRDESQNSEQVFQEIVDAISDVFANKITIGDTVFLIEPVQASMIGHAELFGILCHHAELNIEVKELFNRGDIV